VSAHEVPVPLPLEPPLVPEVPVVSVDPQPAGSEELVGDDVVPEEDSHDDPVAAAAASPTPLGVPLYDEVVPVSSALLEVEAAPVDFTMATRSPPLGRIETTSQPWPAFSFSFETNPSRS